MRRNPGTLIVVLVVAVALLSVAALTSQPPGPEVRAEVAHALEAVLPVLDEQSVTKWTAEGRRPEGAADDPVADAVAGLVPGGQITAIEVGRGTVTFIAAPRLFGMLDSPLTRWVWTWHADPASPGPDDISENWTFETRRPGSSPSAPSPSSGQGETGVPTVSSAAASSATLASGDASCEYA
jgi:hypothetical protein